jgi:choline transporter-like protein 2/4/5
MRYYFSGTNVLFIIVLFFLIQRIDIAIEVVRESAKALLDMKWLSVFPVFPCIIVVCYLLAWIVSGLYIYSVPTTKGGESNPAPEGSRTYSELWMTQDPVWYGKLVVAKNLTNPYVPVNVTSFPVNVNNRYVSIYHLFHMFWVTQFFFYFGYLVFSGAAADWYFTGTDSHGHKRRGMGTAELSHFPVFSSFCRSFRYHQGTIAIASFIIAVVKTIRAIVLYLEHQTKGEPPNQLQKALFCLLHCYLKCVECCLDKINKYALVWTAVYGDGFCVAACSSFALVWRNLFRVAALHTVSTIIFIMGKLTVALMTAGVVCLTLMYHPTYKNTISSPLLPSLVCFGIAYVIAGLFYIVLDSIIDTIFLCFLIDSEVNGKGEMMATPALQKLVGKYSKQSVELAKSYKKNRHNRPSPDEVDDFHQDYDEHTMPNQAEKEMLAVPAQQSSKMV